MSQITGSLGAVANNGKLAIRPGVELHLLVLALKTQIVCFELKKKQNKTVTHGVKHFVLFSG